MINIENFNSVVQTQASSKVSDKYKFIPTTAALEVLADYGWLPEKIVQARTRIEENQGFQKHMIRLTNERLSLELGSNVVAPQILLKNSHCGTAAFDMSIGLKVFLCSNGLNYVTDKLGSLKIRHVGFQQLHIADATQSLVKALPDAMQRVEDFRAIKLTEEERLIFAESAIELRYDGDKYAVRPSDMLRPYRSAEVEPTLWNTFNVVQEKVIKGGVRQQRADGTRIRSRAVSNIDENTKLNRALWSMAEKMAQLKAAN